MNQRSLSENDSPSLKYVSLVRRSDDLPIIPTLMNTFMLETLIAWVLTLVTGSEAPNVIRYGEQTYDEFFVSEATAQKGIVIENHSNQELVMLKHFCHNAGAPDAGN